MVRAEEGQLVELVSDHNPSPEAPPRNKRGGSQQYVKRESTVREAMEKVRNLGPIEREEARKDNPIKYFLSTGVRSTF